jgi:adenosine deaminase
MKTVFNILLTSLFFISAAAIGSGGRYYEEYVIADYDIGKKVFLDNVVCASCPYPNLELEASEVKKIIPELQKEGSIGKYLSLRDRRSVELFLSERFNL